MAWLTVAQQDRMIRREWPFRTVVAGSDLGLWRGEIVSLSARYQISVLYVTAHEQDSFEYDHAWFPEVRVLEPRLIRRPEAPDVPIPHVYGEGLNDLPVLCLFDPAERGWWPDQPIATTTLPLVADWLRFHEAWMATGVWTGGGRDHGLARPAAAPPDGSFPNVASAQATRRAGLASSRSALASRLVDGATPFRSQLGDLLRPRGMRQAIASEPATMPMSRAA